jgi:CBS domain-containing protein
VEGPKLARFDAIPGVVRIQVHDGMPVAPGCPASTVAERFGRALSVEIFCDMLRMIFRISIRRQEPSMKVKDVMHKGAEFADSATPVAAIAKQMRDADIGALPVKAGGRLVGMVTDRDIACRALANGGDFNRMTAKDIMSGRVVCCTPDDDIADAIDTMEKKKVRRLPVTDRDENIIGMVSLGDIAHKVGKDLSGEVLRAVSAHHR